MLALSRREETGVGWYQDACARSMHTARPELVKPWGRVVGSRGRRPAKKRVAQNIRGGFGRQAGQQGGCHDAVDAVGLRARTKTKTYYAEAQAWDDASPPRCPTIKFLPELLLHLE